jgi:single-strand DNA-binding protein
MSDANTLFIQGRLTRDVEVRHTQGGMAVASFGIASNDKYKDEERVCFLDCAAFGKSGEALARFHKKGDAIILQGKLRLEKWQAKDGSNRSKHSLAVDRWHFVGGKRDSQPEPQPAQGGGWDQGSMGDQTPF